MTRLTKIACGIGAALALSYGGSASAAVPVNTALAESILNVSNFQIRLGDNAVTRSSSLIGVKGSVPGDLLPDFNCDSTVANDCEIELLSVNSNGDTLSELNGGSNSKTSSGLLGSAFDLRSYVGTNGQATDFPNPGTPIAGEPTANFTAGASITTGNAIVGQDNIVVHSVGSLISTGSASGQSNQGLKSTTFTILALSDIWLEMSFDADGYLRSALGQDGINADASYSWNLTIDDITTAGLAQFVNWTPNGSADSVVGSCDDPSGVSNDSCREWERGGYDPVEDADGFSLNDGISTGLTADVTREGSGGFQLEVLFKAGRKYTLQLTHSTIANAEMVSIPEPGTLALLGAGLMGIGLRRRKVA